MQNDTFPDQSGGRPAWLKDLTESEGLLVWTFRHWCAGAVTGDHRHWFLVRKAFSERLGAERGRLALVCFERLFRSLAAHGLRPLRYHRPCCPCLGEDEVWLVSLVAACQRGVAAGFGVAYGHVGEAGLAGFCETAIAFATAFGGALPWHDLGQPPGQSITFARAARPGPERVH